MRFGHEIIKECGASMLRCRLVFIAAMILLPHSFTYSWQATVAAETEDMVRISGDESGMSLQIRRQDEDFPLVAI